MRPLRTSIAFAPAFVAFVAGCGAKTPPPSDEHAAPAAASIDVSPPIVAPPVVEDAKLASIAMQTPIFDRPDRASHKLGYLRLGAVVARSMTSVPGKDCDGAWYRIDAAAAGAGFVCVSTKAMTLPSPCKGSDPSGKNECEKKNAYKEEATLDPKHPILRGLARLPDLSKPMPYPYAFARARTSLYLQLPTKDEQAKMEFGLAKHLAVHARHLETWNDVDGGGANEVPLDEHGVPTTPPNAPMPKAPQLDERDLFGGLLPGETSDAPPWWLHLRAPHEDGTRYDRDLPNVSSFASPPYAVKAGKIERHAGLALVGDFLSGPASGNRRFAVALDGRLIATDKLKPEYASPFHGVVIDGTHVKVPFAIVRKKNASFYDGQETGSHWRAHGDATWRSIVPLTGKEKKFPKHSYLEAADGRWLDVDDVAYVGDPNEWPKEFDYTKTKWIDVGIWSQVAVAYEGKRAVYATLVSTGLDGMGDPKTTKSTVRGAFRIDAKHVTTTMDADDPQSHFELRDVPWVQYFEGSYALHGTYWHDDFGKPRSHGCINLAPIDARWLFFWTDPPLPKGWHGVRSRGDLVQGTWVRVRG